MNKILVVYHNEKFENQIKYAAGILFDNHKIECSTVAYSNFSYKNYKDHTIIYYGNNLEFDFANIIVPQGNLFGEDYLSKSSLIDDVKFHKELPVFFNSSIVEGYVINHKEKLIINIDIFQTIFYFLTCYEEFVFDKYDNNGRFEIKNSILYKFNLISSPVVNENIDFFINILSEKLNCNIEKKNLWGKKDFSVMLSHDVDIIRKHLTFKREMRLLLSMILIDKKPKEVFKRIKDFVDIYVRKVKCDPFDTFKYILELENEKNYKSSFFFMADEKTYDLESNRVKDIIKKIVDNESEIGFHPGLNTSNNKIKFKNQLDILKHKLNICNVSGVRQHYLSFNSSKTWVIHEECDFKYDTTVCFPQQAGFKVGYCLPYNAYDLTGNKTLNLIEIPLILMEVSLLGYMKLNYNDSLEYIKNLIIQVKKHKGVFVVLWHNSALTKEFNEDSLSIFKWLYSILEKENCIVQSGINIYNLFLNKDMKTKDI